jgi:hypothetical protein
MAGIKHIFQSGIPDSSDLTLINPSNWNAIHDIPASGIQVGDAATNEMTGLTAASNFQKLQSKVGGYEFKSSPWYYQDDYDFAAITPLVGLTAGVAATVTLSPFPPGITSTSTGNHKLRLTDSSAVADETITIIAVVVGTSITFIPALSHASGNWSLISGTGGIQEAVKAAELAPNGGQVQLREGNTFVYGTTTLFGIPYVRVQGCGSGVTNIIVDTTFTSGDTFYCGATSQTVTFASFSLGAYPQHASGFGIHIGPISSGHSSIFDVYMIGLANGIYLEDADYTMVSQFVYDQGSNQNAVYGLKISKGSSLTISRCVIFGEHPPYTLPTAGLLKYGIWVDEVDGVAIDQVHLRADVGLQIRGKNAVNSGTVVVSNSIIDTCRQKAIQIDVEIGATPGVFGNFTFTGCHLISNQESGADLIYIEGSKCTGYVSFVNNFIAGGQNDGIYALNCKYLNISDNLIADNNISNGLGSGIKLVGGDVITIVNNQLFDQRGVPLQRYGINIAGGTVINLRESGNVFKGNVSAAFINLATMSSSLIESTKVFEGSVASAGTIAIPTFMPGLLTISGTTTIDTITGFTGPGHILYLKTTSALTFSAAGNISTAVTTTAGQFLTARYNSSTSKWDIG